MNNQWSDASKKGMMVGAIFALIGPLFLLTPAWQAIGGWCFVLGSATLLIACFYL